MRKALFFDIDGTIISERPNDFPDGIPDSTREALVRAKELGHLTFINTGRTDVFLPHPLKEISFTGYLCGCGTRIECEGKELLHREIPDERMQEIIKLIREAKMDGILEGTYDIYFQGEESPVPALHTMLSLHRMASKSIHMNWDEPDISVDKFVVFTYEKSNPELLFTSLKEDFEIIDRRHGFYEIVPKGYSKASAIDYALEYYGVSKKDAYVFGDSSNDLTMFRHIPNAIAMQEHDPVLDPYTSFVTRSVEENGIAFAMEKLGLI